MKLRCPACGLVHEVETNLPPGQRVECSCGHKFVVSPDSVVTDDRAGPEKTGEPAAHCPACGAGLPADRLAPGEKVACPSCGAAVEIVEGADSVPPAAGAAPAAGEVAQNLLPRGTTIGRCRIEECIGVGGMGAVYRAHHQTLDIPVAVKIMLPQYTHRPDFKERFYREARTAARLNHPNVVRVLDCGEENGLLFLVMEYVDGGNVRDLLKARGRLTPLEVIDIGIAVCRALTEAARHRIIHRDIKPDNIMRTKDGVCKLADLGLAKQISETPGDTSLTMAAVTMGTPFYMAPEQAVDARRCDARSDIYALGATLYHLLCGRPPFTGDSAFEIMQKHVSGACPPPSTLNPETPPQLERIIARAMMKKPEDRYQSAEEMLRDLETLKAELSGVPTSGGAPPASAAKPKAERRRWIGYAAAAAALVVLLCLTAAIRSGKNRTSRDQASSSTSGLAAPGSELPGKGAPGVPEKTAFRFRSIRIDVIHRLQRKPEAYIHIAVQPSADTETFATGSVRYAGLNYDMQRTPEGTFAVTIGPAPPPEPGQQISVALRKEKKGTARRVFTIPPHPEGVPQLRKPDKGPVQHQRTESEIVVRWTPPPKTSGVNYRIEIGRILLTGEWLSLYSKEAGQDVDHVVIPRRDLVMRLYGISWKATLFTRLIAWRDLFVPGIETPVRWSIIVEEPVRRPLHWVAASPPAAIWQWAESLDSEDRDACERACRSLIEKEGSKVLPFFWKVAAGSNSTQAYWAAYILAEIAQQKEAVIAFDKAFPTAIDKRSALRLLRERWRSSKTAFPPAFGDLLRDVDRRGVIELGPGRGFRPGFRPPRPRP